MTSLNARNLESVLLAEPHGPVTSPHLDAFSLNNPVPALRLGRTPGGSCDNTPSKKGSRGLYCPSSFSSSTGPTPPSPSTSPYPDLGPLKRKLPQAEIISAQGAEGIFGENFLLKNLEHKSGSQFMVRSGRPLSVLHGLA